MPRTLLTEARDGTDATPVTGKPGRFLLTLISPGWGASGYYSPEVLEAAARARVFAAGMHSYLDHPHGDGSGVDDRGNRSINDLASVLAEDARTTDSGALVAEATVFGPYRDVLAQMRESIGVSIRAYAETSVGEAEGRRGTIVDELVEGISADYVTRAGRGGRIEMVLESARQEIREARNIGQWIESRIHRDFTITADDMAGDGRLTREERISLSAAIGDALASFVGRLEADQPQLYTRDLWEDPQDTIATAIEAAKNVPDHPAGRHNRSEEDTMPEIAESELRTLREAAGRVDTLESERDQAVTERDEARGERDTLREAQSRRERATTINRIVGEAAEAADVHLDEDQRAGIATRAVFAADGSVNESETLRVAGERVARIKESQGTGRPRGLGQSTPVGESDQTVSESYFDELDAAIFGPIQEA